MDNAGSAHFTYVDGNPLASTNAAGNFDNDYNYTPVNERYPGASPGSYVVSSGDTLRAIALAVYGDARLWFLIAQANGLSSDADLRAGQTLNVPNRVTNLYASAQTVRPYSPGEIVGDTTPTLPDPPPPPPPPRGRGCGGFGQFLTAVVTIAVSVMLGPAVGNIAGQVMGNITGVQRGFNFRSFAIAVVTPGIMQGAGITDAIHTLGADAWMTKAVTAAAGSVVGQGVAIVVGAQKRFEWRAVAAAAIGGAAGHAFGTAIAVAASPIGENFARSVVTQAVANRGRVDFVSVAADVFGNLLGNTLREQFGTREQQPRQVESTRLGFKASQDQIDRALPLPPSATTSIGDPFKTDRFDTSGIFSGGRLPNATSGDGGAQSTAEVAEAPSWRSGDDAAPVLGLDDGSMGMSEEPLFPAARAPSHPSGTIEREQRQRATGAGTKPVPSLEARTRGRQLFDAAINGTLGQVPLGPANDPSSAAQTYPSTPGGAALYIERPRLAGARVINVGVGTMQTALDVVAATEAPVFSQVAGAASALIYVWQRDWVGAGLAVAGIAPIIGAGADATRLGVRAADAAKGGAANIAAHEAYKDGLRAAMSKPAVSDPALARLIDPLYRPNATVGSGSTAAAIRQELATGQPVGAAFHSQKAADSIRALERWLSKNPAARPGDRAAAENVIKDMSNALGGR